MKELVRTSDIVRMQILRSLLAEEGIETLVLDEHSGSLFGGIGGIGPRLMVLDDDRFDEAVDLAVGAGLIEKK